MAATPHIALGKRIRQAREIAGLSQQDVATHLGITRNAVSLWEKGLSCPEATRQEPLANLLRATTQWLTLGEGKAPVAAGPGSERTPPKEPLWLDVSVHIQGGVPVVTLPMARFLDLIGRAK